MLNLTILAIVSVVAITFTRIAPAVSVIAMLTAIMCIIKEVMED